MPSRHCPSSRRPAASTVLAAVTVLSLAACANPEADQAAIARTTLVGLPKQTLLSCAGVPHRTAEADGAEYFTYYSGRLVSYPRPAFGYPWYGYPYYRGYPWYPWYGDFGGYDVQQYSCEANFTLRNGVVEQLNYSGSYSLSQCYTIVANCLALVPPPTLPGPSVGPSPPKPPPASAP